MYTGGSRLVTRTIRGVLCGFLLCYDSCFPRLFEAYRDRGVKLLFLSMYNARNPGGRNSLDALMEAQLATRAADNGMWICVSNSSAKHSRISARVIGPDGAAVSLRRNVSGLLTCNLFERELGWTYDNRDEEMAARARVAIEQ